MHPDSFSDAPLCAVLDSNIWVDILIFDDPHSRPIRAALESGALVAPVDARCLGELTRVLEYTQFARHFERAGSSPAAALATFMRLARHGFVATEAAPATPVAEAVAAAPAGLLASPPRPAAALRPLPLCSDPDDQKFLELAQACGASWLVSKDRALLKLARRVQRDFGFRIGLPQVFVDICLGARASTAALAPAATPASSPASLPAPSPAATPPALSTAIPTSTLIESHQTP